jgi:hypothetical protein
MAQQIKIQLTSAGACSGPVDLYSDADNYVNAFASNISITVLTSALGYNTSAAPIGTTTIRIQNSLTNHDCNDNFVDVIIIT